MYIHICMYACMYTYHIRAYSYAYFMRNSRMHKPHTNRVFICDIHVHAIDTVRVQIYMSNVPRGLAVRKDGTYCRKEAVGRRPGVHRILS